MDRIDSILMVDSLLSKCVGVVADNYIQIATIKSIPRLYKTVREKMFMAKPIYINRLPSEFVLTDEDMYTYNVFGLIGFGNLRVDDFDRIIEVAGRFSMTQHDYTVPEMMVVCDYENSVLNIWHIKWEICRPDYRRDLEFAEINFDSPRRHMLDALLSADIFVNGFKYDPTYWSSYEAPF